MASREPQTRSAIDECLLKRPIIFYLSPTHRTICVMASTTDEMHRATSVLHAIVGTRMKKGTGRNTTEIMVYRHTAAQPDRVDSSLNQQSAPGTVEAT
jgi:hypothetical protein